MAHRIAVIAAAVVFSLTIGVLVGVVVHAAQLQHADDRTPRVTTTTPPAGGVSGPPTGTSPSPGGTSSSGDPATDSGGPATGSVTAPATLQTFPVDPVIAQHGASSSAAVSTTVSTTVVTTPATSSSTAPTTGSSPATSTTGTTTSTRRPVVIYTTVGAPSSAPSSASSSGPVTTTTTAVIGPTTTPPPPTSAPGQGDVAGASCPVLGQQSATAAGVTLFCQSNQRGPGLAWREVVAGGGCLNRTMTGIGADGHHYACRLGDGGLNHWVRVD